MSTLLAQNLSAQRLFDPREHARAAQIIITDDLISSGKDGSAKLHYPDSAVKK
jgi:hypothetical protein